MHPFIVLVDMVRKDYEKLFTHLEPPEPPAGLLDRILLAIKHEQELRHTKRLAFGFLALLVISVSTAPISWSFFSGEVAASGVLQFISIAISDLGAFLALWPDSFMAVAESLPVTSLTLFAINMTLAVFTLRLFLHRKRMLLDYFLHGMRFA